MNSSYFDHSAVLLPFTKPFAEVSVHQNMAPNLWSLLCLRFPPHVLTTKDVMDDRVMPQPVVAPRIPRQLFGGATPAGQLSTFPLLSLQSHFHPL